LRETIGFDKTINGECSRDFVKKCVKEDSRTQEERLALVNNLLYDSEGNLVPYFEDYCETYWKADISQSEPLAINSNVHLNLEKMANYILYATDNKKEESKTTYHFHKDESDFIKKSWKKDVPMKSVIDKNSKKINTIDEYYGTTQEPLDFFIDANAFYYLEKSQNTENASKIEYAKDYDAMNKLLFHDPKNEEDKKIFEGSKEKIKELVLKRKDVLDYDEREMINSEILSLKTIKSRLCRAKFHIYKENMLKGVKNTKILLMENGERIEELRNKIDNIIIRIAIKGEKEKENLQTLQTLQLKLTDKIIQREYLKEDSSKCNSIYNSFNYYYSRIKYENNEDIKIVKDSILQTIYLEETHVLGEDVVYDFFKEFDFLEKLQKVIKKSKNGKEENEGYEEEYYEEKEENENENENEDEYKILRKVKKREYKKPLEGQRLIVEMIKLKSKECGDNGIEEIFNPKHIFDTRDAVEFFRRQMQYYIDECNFNGTQLYIIQELRNGRTLLDIGNFLESRKQNIYNILTVIVNTIIKKHNEEIEDWYYLNIVKGTYKKCKECGEVLLVNSFDVKTDMKDKYNKICKICQQKKDSERKFCTKCGKNKILDLFGNRADMPDGKKTWCKHCEKEYKRQIREKALYDRPLVTPS